MISVLPGPFPVRPPSRIEDNQDVIYAVAIQSAKSIFRKESSPVRLAMLSQPRNYRERHALRHN